MEKTFKRLSLVLIAALFFCVGLFFVACDDGNEDEKPGDEPQPSAEQGEYYYAASATEDYELALELGNTFKLSIAGESLEGSYTITGEQVTLTAGSTTYSATYYNDAVTLSYKNASYRFLRKTYYTVSFNTAGGSSVKDASVMNGKTASKPDDPTLTGSTFVGWYTDSGFKTAFSFSQPITANVTLYARFVENIDPEFKVSFDANHVGAADIPAQTTVGHKLYSLPTPEWDGHTFLGWWYSSYNDENKLTAKYEEQTIEEPMTLFAVWEDEKDLAISVSASGIKWQARTGNNTYTVSVTDSDNKPVVASQSTASASYDVDFSELPAGDYTIKVTLNGSTSTAYYKNKALARVTDFKVEGSKLLFNSVSGATNYILTVKCGTAEHAQNHTHESLDLKTETSFDFSACDMMADGIVFTVEATKEGYLSSTNTFSFKRELAAVSSLNFDANDSVSWDPVENAQSYNVVVLLDGQEVLSKNVGLETKLDLQYYNRGEVTVSVTPVAFGWISPAATQNKYTKTHLATPQNLHLENASTIVWDPVDGATDYTVVFDGKTYTVNNDNKLDLAGKYSTSKSSFALTVQATAGSVQSLATPEFTIRSGAMGEVSYEAGYVTWDAVFGYSAFLVKVGEADPVTVENATSYKPTFTAKGETTISVAVKDNAASPTWKTTKVMVYAIEFDADGGDGAFAPYYVVQGDPLSDLPEPSWFGYEFAGWFTEKAGEGLPFNGPTFEDNYDRTVYAKWNAQQFTITLTYGQYSNELTGSQVVPFGSKYKLPNPESTNDAYAFAGWYSVNDAYTDYRGYSITEFLDGTDISLTAKWVPVLSFEKNSSGNLTANPGEGINYVSSVRIPSIYQNTYVDKIGDFQGCTNLETLYIPDRITEIVLGSNGLVFQNCSKLTNIEVYQADDAPYAGQVYYSVNGVLFYWSGSRMELKVYPYARQDSEYTIPDVIENAIGADNMRGDVEVSYIAAGAFHSANYNTSPLTKLNIPATIDFIEEGAFFYFYNLSELNFLPAQNGHEAEYLTIRPNAFGDPDVSLSTSRIKSVHFPSRTLTENPRDSFANMLYISYVDVESGGQYTAIDGLLVQESEKYGPELVYYPVNRQVDENGKAYIPEGFTTSGRAKEFIVPRGIKSIGEDAVRNVTALDRIVITDEVVHIGKSAFEGTTGVDAIEFQGTTYSEDLIIEERAFLGQRWPDKILSNSYPTTSNSSLTSLTLPANLVELGVNAFGGYTRLSSVNVNVDRSADKIKFATDAFAGLNNGASFTQSNVKNLTFATTVPYLEVLNIFGPNVESLGVEGNPNYKADDNGVIWGTNDYKDQLVLFPATFEGAYQIPDGLMRIQSGMFKNRTGLTAVTIPASVIEIGSQAFLGCTALESVIFIDGGEEELTIRNNAFDGCKVLKDVKLPERLVHLGSQAFADCKLLTEITLPASLKEIEINATYGLDVFDGCDLLETINVSDKSEYFVFQGGVLYSLRKALPASTSKPEEVINVPDKVLYVPLGAPEELKISGYISSISPLAFSRYNADESAKLNIKKIEFEDSIVTYNPEKPEEKQNAIVMFISEGASSTASPFYKLLSLQEIHFPKGMTKMGRYLVYSCTNLQKVNVPNTVTSIEPESFYGCTGVTEFTYEPGGVDELRIEDAYVYNADMYSTYYSLYGTMSKITRVEFPERLSYLGGYAFYYSSSSTSSNNARSAVTEIIFPKKMKSLELGVRAFSYTLNLQTLQLPEEGLKAIPGYCFYSSKIKSVTIPESVTSFDDYAFYYASDLESVNIPKNLTKIGAYAFNSVKKLSGKLVIPKTVESIGNSAFTGTGFSEIEIEDGNKLGSIGLNAFSGSTAIKSFKFGTSETPLTIGNNAFAGDSGLKTITLPANLKSLGDSVFLNCTGLGSITFDVDKEGKSLLESIGKETFSKTTISEMTFPESRSESGLTLGINLFKSCTYLTKLSLSPSIMALDGVLAGCASIETIDIKDNEYLEADEKLPIIYRKGAGGERSIMLIYGVLAKDNARFKIASGSAIGSNAFANQTELEYVYIPASVRSIGNNAFANCINLKTVEIQKGSVLTSIGAGAFMNCVKLESINLQDALYLSTLGDGTGNYTSFTDPFTGEKSYPTTSTGIFAKAGIESENPLRIIFPKSKSITKLGNYMFMNCGATEIDMSGLTALTDIPAGSGASSSVTYLYGCFSQMRNLKTIKFPASLEYIGNNAFVDCTSLEKVDLSNCTNLKYIDKSKKTSLPSSTTSATFIFARCSGLQEVIFPESLELLGAWCFAECTNLSSIKGIENVKVFGSHAFDSTAITSFDFNVFSEATTLPANLFQNCTKLTKVDLTPLKNVKSLPNYMFSGCTSLQAVSFPSDGILTHLGQYTFENCTSLQKIDLSVLKDYVRISSGASTKVSSGTSGASYLFRGCTSLSSVKLPDTVTEIGGFTFENCTSLKEFDFTNIQKIGKNCFYNTGFTTLTIPSGMTNLYEGAFSYMKDLQSVTFEKGGEICALTAGSQTTSSTRSSYGVFEGSALEKFEFNDRVTALTHATFYGCPNLVKIKLPGSITSMGTGVFHNCINLQEVDLTEFTSTLGPSTFNSCTSLTTVRFGSGLKGTNTRTFQDCTALETIDLSNTTLSYIGGYAFLGCTSLTKVILPETLTYFEGYVFQDCIQLPEIDLTKTQVTVLSTKNTNTGSDSTYLFNGCSELKEVKTLPGQIKVVAQYTFQDCVNLTTFDLTGATDLGGGSFLNSGLTGTVKLSKDLTAFRSTTSQVYPFEGCKNITKFEIDGASEITLTTPSGDVLKVEEGQLYLYDAAGSLVALVGSTGAGSSEGGVLDLGNDENYSSGISQFVSHQFEGATYEKVILPKTLTTLPTYLFSNSHVKEVVLPEALTEIPNYMFDGSDLETVVIPASVTNIGTNAFAHTPNLTSVTFAEPAAGEDPLPLTITAGGNTASTSTGAFYGSGLARLTLPDRLTAIPTSTFAYMTGLEELVIPKTITTIPNYCFIGSKISGLFLNGAINGIGNYAYSSTTGLKDITAEDLKGVVAIGTDAFESSSVETAVIPGTVVGSSLPPSTSNPTTLLYLFRYCENLTSVEFEDTAEGTERSVTLNQIFRDNPLLETVKIGEGIISFSTNVIANCPNLTTLTLPETLTNISNGTLDGCPNVKKIVLGTQLTTVGPLAFYMWDETRTICFRSSAYYIGSLIGFDWMFNTKATVIFDYEGD